MSRYASRSLLLLGLMAFPSFALLVGGADADVELGRVPVTMVTQRAVAARAVAVDTVQTYETDHFFIVYSIEGVHKTVLSNNGDLTIPTIGAFAENAWRLAIDTLGYKTPPVNAETTWYYKKPIPLGKLPIEIVDLGTVSSSFRGQPYMGYSVYPTAKNGGIAEILLENDFLYDSSGVKKAVKVNVTPPERPGTPVVWDYSLESYMLDGWVTAVSHEFFHCVEMSYEYSYRYAFHEMSAAWFAMRASVKYGAVHHWGTNQSFLANRNGGAFATGDIATANGLFVRAVAGYAGESIVRKLWESRSTNISSSALVPEENWFRHTIDSLKLDLFGFIDYYASEIGCMVANSACDLNDDGGFISAIPSISYVDPSFSDTTNDFLALPVGEWGGNWRGISKSALSKAVTRYRIEKYRDTLHDGGFVLHLPSRTYEAFSLRKGPAVVAERSDDTLLVFWGVSAGGVGAGLSAFPTNAPVTVASAFHRPASWSRVKARYDLRGRPLSEKKSGVYFERLENGGARLGATLK